MSRGRGWRGGGMDSGGERMRTGDSTAPTRVVGYV